MRDITIQSHRGPYTVHFGGLFAGLENGLKENEHLIIDSKVADLYKTQLSKALAGPSVLKIEAKEPNKSLERIPDYVKHLLEKKVRRNHRLVCVGGGIVQDITAFIAACLLRGVEWSFYPTTLLAQADSCIGSKSSINVGPYKNQVGTFTPPKELFISSGVLDTLDEKDIRSGIGEMIKVHIIGGQKDTDQLIQDFPTLLTDREMLIKTLWRSLEIKKKYIELDEFDQKERLVMNYGHTFGHAIEGATDYGVPHGIAVTMGMHMSNFISAKLGFVDQKVVDEIHPVLAANYAGFENTAVPMDRFFDGLRKDKKNLANDISMILMRGPGQVFIHRMPLDEKLKNLCVAAFEAMKETVQT